MQIQINTDHNITGDEPLANHIRSVVESTLSRFAGQISRVEVHLSDEAGGKAGVDDKRCMMEVRIDGRQPTAVTHHAATVHQAVDGATVKLERAVEGIFDKLRHH